MRRILPRIIKSLIWPAGLPVVAALILIGMPELKLTEHGWWQSLPHVFFGGALLFAARFAHARVALATIGFWCAAEAFTGGRVDTNHIFALMGVLFLLVAVVPERGLIHPLSIPHLFIVLAVGTLSLWPATWTVQMNTYLAHLDWMPDQFDQPLGVMLLYFASGGVLLYRTIQRQKTVDSGLNGVIVTWLWLLNADSANRSIILVAGAAICLFTALESGHALAFRDQLTGLPSRRALDMALTRLGGRYTLAMVDVDHFKKFNDKYGHDAGDEALRMVASHLQSVRGGGKAYRYGGEEFAVVFSGRKLGDSKEHLEALRKSIADARFVLRSSDRPKKRPKTPKKGTGRGSVKLTVSIGASQRTDKNPTTDDVLKMADKLLYRAKKGGRNKVMAA